MNIIDESYTDYIKAPIKEEIYIEKVNRSVQGKF